MKVKKLIAESIELHDSKGNLRMSLHAYATPAGPSLDLYGEDRSAISLSIFEGTANITIREPDGRTAITIARRNDGRLGITVGNAVLAFPGLPKRPRKTLPKSSQGTKSQKKKPSKGGRTQK